MISPRIRSALAIVLLSMLAAGGCAPNASPIAEASGVTRHGDSLLIVDDEQNGAYFRFELQGERGPTILLDRPRLTRIELADPEKAVDLESVDILADGRVVVLSEQSRSLFSSEGVVAEYDVSLEEFAKRGLEGVAVRPLEDGSSLVAVLWEGGYPEYDQVPPEFRESRGRMPTLPLIDTHTVKPGESGLSITPASYFPLQVPLPTQDESPRGQRFRAPDLVWHQAPNGMWGFVVLLTSMNSEGERQYLFHWLQRFDGAGEPYGEPLDLNAIVPEALVRANWEGLAWFEPGESLVLVHENYTSDEGEALVVTLPDSWR